MHWFSQLRPALERQIGRAVKGEQRRCAQFHGESGNDTPRPAVERVGLAILGFQRLSEGRPVAAADETDEAQCLHLGQVGRMKDAAEGEAGPGDGAKNFGI